MSLAAAIRNRARPLADAQNTYKQNVILVNTLITSVLNSSLPTLHQNPPDWADFAAAYETAEGQALTWATTVMDRLLSVPSSVLTYDSVIAALLKDATAQAATLLQNPNDTTAQLILSNDLKQVTGQFNMVSGFIAGAITALQNFQDQLPAMATQLQTIATKAINDANADKVQIQKLQNDIATLQSDIQSLTAALVGLGIADGVALTLGLVTTIALWPVGALVWFALGPVVAVATTYIALDAKQIVADKAAISQDQQQMSDLTADVAALNALSQNFASMAASAQQLETTLQSVLQEWQTLESDVATAVADIQAAQASGSNYAAVQADLVNASSEWAAAYAQVGTLNITLQVNSAQLSYGMSSQEVQGALSTGTVVDLIDYYNQVGVARASRKDPLAAAA